MKLIKSSFEILTNIDGIKLCKDIELISRTCYRSESKITETSYLDFIPKLISRGHFAMLEFGGMITVKFIVDRGVSHELVRHRLSSFAQESTRYCNYGKGEHIQFIIPSWLYIQEGIIDLDTAYNDYSEYDGSLQWISDCINCERNYLNKVNQINPKTGKVDKNFKKWTPQEARSVLINSLKTEINMSANIREWREIFKQRTSNAAHPQMQEVMRPLLDEFKQLIPILFNDINYETKN